MRGQIFEAGDTVPMDWYQITSFTGPPSEPVVLGKMTFAQTVVVHESPELRRVVAVSQAGPVFEVDEWQNVDLDFTPMMQVEWVLPKIA